MAFNTDWNRVHDEVDWLTEPDSHLIQFLDEHYKVGEDRVFLDVGCGTGASTLPLLERGFKVFAIDGAAKAIASLRSRNEPNLACILGDASTLGLEPQVLDAVIDGVTFSMMPLEDVAAIIRRSRRWLKTGGRIFSKMLKTLPPPRFNRTYARPTTPDEISLLFEGFNLEVRESLGIIAGTGDHIRHYVIDAQLVDPLT